MGLGHDSWIGTALQIAAAHGRFPKPSSYTYFFPYLLESQYLQAAVRLGCILFGALLAGNLLRRAIGIRGSGILFVLCFFAFAQNTDSHNLFVAYPFAWEFSWICWMAGLLGLMVALKAAVHGIRMDRVGNLASWLARGVCSPDGSFLAGCRYGEQIEAIPMEISGALCGWACRLVDRLGSLAGVSPLSNYEGAQLKLDAAVGDIAECHLDVQRRRLAICDSASGRLEVQLEFYTREPQCPRYHQGDSSIRGTQANTRFISRPEMTQGCLLASVG